MRAQRPRTFAAAAVGVAFVAFCVRAIYVWQIRDSVLFDVLIGDARGYDAWAQRIAGGDWLGRDVFYQAPLYPYFLGALYALAGRDLLIVRIVQALIGTSACALLALGVRRLHNERAGLIAGLSLAAYAPAVFFDGLLQKSVLDVFFIALLVWLLSRLIDNPASRPGWLGAGAALGALALTRENALVFVVPIVIWTVWRCRRAAVSCAAPLVAFALGMSLVLIPVAVRNKLVGGEWHLTTSQFGPNFYLGNNPKADGTAGALREGRGSVEHERQDAIDLAQAAEGRTLSPGEVSRYWTGQAITFIRTDPARWLSLLARKTRLLFNRAEIVDTESQETYEDSSTLLRTLAYVANFGVLATLAIFGAIAGWEYRERLWLIYALAAIYAVSVVAFFVTARYRLPLVPFMIAIAAVGVTSAARFRRTASVRTQLVASLVVVAIAVFSNWPIWAAGTMKAVTENNLAIALQTDTRFSDAENHFRRAIELKPDYAPAYISLGELFMEQERPKEAVEAYLRAGALGVVDPQLDGRIADAYNNLIVALMAANRSDEAMNVFPHALQFDPTNGKLHFAYGSLLFERGRHREAAAEFRSGLAGMPDSAQGHESLGVALAAGGNTEEAIAEFERALALQPDLASARRNLEIARGSSRRK